MAMMIGNRIGAKNDPKEVVVVIDMVVDHCHIEEIHNKCCRIESSYCIITVL